MFLTSEVFKFKAVEPSKSRSTQAQINNIWTCLCHNKTRNHPHFKTSKPPPCPGCGAPCGACRGGRPRPPPGRRWPTRCPQRRGRGWAPRAGRVEPRCRRWEPPRWMEPQRRLEQAPWLRAKRTETVGLKLRGKLPFFLPMTA